MSDFSGPSGPLRLGRRPVLSTYPDQLIIYQGNRSNPAFLCALDTSRSFWTSFCYLVNDAMNYGWHHARCTRYEVSYQEVSALPAGLTQDVDALPGP